MKASNVISKATAQPSAAAKSGESFSSIERFRLSGPSADLDPRHHAYRGDLADVALASRLFAPHYAEAVKRRLSSEAKLMAAPSESAGLLGQMASGEEFALLDVTGGWAWGYRTIDHLVGYIPEASLG